MVNVKQPWNNKRFVQYDNYVEKKGKQVTKHPVFFGLIDTISPNRSTESRHDDKKAAAALIKHNKPTDYQVVMRDHYFYRNQNNPSKVKKILSHEVAHINYPDTHGPAWQREARRLGAGEYATARGTVKKRR